jgi:plasmid stabilization system protein ParE
VAQVVYSACAVENIERGMQLLREKNPEVAITSAAAIFSAVENLASNPLIGRRVEGDLRELVISYGATVSREINREMGARRHDEAAGRYVSYSGGDWMLIAQVKQQRSWDAKQEKK